MRPFFFSVFNMIITTPRTIKGLKTLEKHWEFSADGPVFSDIICADINRDGIDEVVFSTSNEVVTCLDINGRLLWKRKIEPKSLLEGLFLDQDNIRIRCSSPVACDINNDGRDEILMGSAGSGIYAFDCAGNSLWECRTGGPVNSTPAFGILGRESLPTLAVGCNDSSLYAISAEGRVLWKYSYDYPIDSRIRIADIDDDGRNEIVFGSAGNSVVVLDCEGRRKWSYLTEGAVSGAAGIGVLSHGGMPKIVAGSKDSHIYVLDHLGNLEWKYRTNGIITSDILLAELHRGQKDIIVGVCSYNSNLLIFSGKDRSLVDSFDAGFWITSAPILYMPDDSSGPKLVFGSYDHNLYVLGLASGFHEARAGLISRSILMYDTGGVIVGRPAVSPMNKLAVVANRNGMVHCVRIR